MDERFEKETRALIRSWMRYDREELRDYLVEDVEDPRVNVQSILTRHFLIEELFPDRFAALKEHELRFALVMNWLLAAMKGPDGDEVTNAALNALLGEADDGEGVAIPEFVRATFAMLPCEADGAGVPNYLVDAIVARPAEPSAQRIEERVLATFQSIWHGILEREADRRVSVLEMGCGSANDYRSLDAFGIARFLDYEGIDLCEKNTQNAREMFPDVAFETGNALEIDAVDGAFDCSFVHDLFEHLSVEAMERAIAELCRVTGRRLCVGFFNMSDRDEHVVRPVDDYHWNELSIGRTRALFEKHASTVEVIHVDALLRSRFGGEAHNKGAYTFVVERQNPSRPPDTEKHTLAGTTRSAPPNAPAASDYLAYLRGRTFASEHHRVLLACFPKSGSTYLARVLSLLPGYSKVALVTGYGRREQELSAEKLLAAHRSSGDYVAQHHVRCSAATERLMGQFGLKPVVLVRNIFDTIVSIRDHLRSEPPDIAQAYVPPDIGEWNDERTFRFIVDMIVPWYFNFFASWSQCVDKLLVTYEDVHADVLGVVRGIGNRYGLDLAGDDIRSAVEEANRQGADTRKNRAVLGRGGSLPDEVRAKVAGLARYYEGIDFAAIGL
ncbi:MAG: class I SAM-dependent methyltransferase [Planctomycetota bacterium]|jgi:SAM-dependent methyltransferase